jgi:hypothetical protein
MIGEMMDEQTEQDVRDIERRIEEPPDELYPAECEHGYTEDCPDCDCGSYLPTVLP